MQSFVASAAAAIALSVRPGGLNATGAGGVCQSTAAAATGATVTTTTSSNNSSVGDASDASGVAGRRRPVNDPEALTATLAMLEKGIAQGHPGAGMLFPLTLELAGAYLVTTAPCLWPCVRAATLSAPCPCSDGAADLSQRAFAMPQTRTRMRVRANPKALRLGAMRGQMR